MNTHWNYKTQAASDTVNAVDARGVTRPFIGFIPDTDGATIVVSENGDTNSVSCLAGHTYWLKGKRINATTTTSTNYTAIFGNVK